jgi:hypothetical protein
MASILKVDTLTGVTTAGSISVTGEGNSTTTNLQQGLIKSWMNLDGDLSTPAVLDSFNTSSIEDVSAGRYTQIVTNAFSNANYSTTIGPDACDGGSTDMHSAVYNSGRATTTTNVHVVGLTTNGGAFADLEHICAMSAGDLA